MVQIAAVHPPSWLRRAVLDSLRACGDRVRAVEVRHGVRGQAVHTVDVSFVVTDMTGRHVQSTGIVRIPDSLRESGGPLPLHFFAGDAVDEVDAQALAAGGRVVVSHDAQAAVTCGRPLSRGINLDAALLHMTRRLPCVDDARVLVQGMGGGGHMALLLAAETFPLAAVVADAAPVNWPHTAAYLSRTAALPGAAPSVVSAARVVRRAAEVIGSNDVETAPWLELSANTHLELITAPVSAVFSTADMMVPIEQVSSEYERIAPPGVFASGYTADPAELLQLPENRERLLERLEPASVDVRLVSTSGAPLLRAGWSSAQALRVGLVPTSRPWSITILDEGCREPHLHHLKHALHVDRAHVLGQLLAQPDVVRQMTEYKLVTLMRRFAGLPWLVHGYPHLDTSQAERADVLRALVTLVSHGGAARFVSLYAALPAGLRVLGPAVGSATPGSIPAVLEELLG